VAVSTIIKNFRDTTITISDNAAALSHTVVYEPGDAAFDSGKHEIAVYRDRGDIAGVRKTNQGLPSGSFSVHYTDLTDAAVGAGTLTDMLDGVGGYATAVSTLGSTSDVYTVKLTFTIAEAGAGSDHVITFDDCFCTWSFAEGDPSTVSVNWTCHGTVTRA
jgi:hypothetical protein